LTISESLGFPKHLLNYCQIEPFVYQGFAVDRFLSKHLHAPLVSAVYAAFAVLIDTLEQVSNVLLTLHIKV